MSEPSPRWTLAELRSHVQAAIELELFTIPAYLTAYYSIRQGASAAADRAADAFLAIFGQEMLHVELACNIVNALGQPPRLTGRAAPSYPGPVPSHKDRLIVTLGPATEAQIEAFIAIELPIDRDPSGRRYQPPQASYGTIGELYDALRFGLWQVFGEDGTPWPTAAHPSIQRSFDDDHFAITDVASALRALDLIILQGEGASLERPTEDHGQLAHHDRLKALLGTLGPGDLRPMRPGSAGIDAGSREARLLDFFDACYSHLLRLLEGAFTEKNKIGLPVGLMSTVITPLALHIAETHAGEGEGTLTPRFRYVATAPAQAYGALDAVDRGAQNVVEVAAALRL
ncbi:MAG: ferritin-like protein [Byssovorax sp.]